jgi:hypothetical protein
LEKLLRVEACFLEYAGTEGVDYYVDAWDHAFDQSGAGGGFEVDCYRALASGQVVGGRWRRRGGVIVGGWVGAIDAED